MRPCLRSPISQKGHRRRRTLTGCGFARVRSQQGCERPIGGEKNVVGGGARFWSHHFRLRRDCVCCVEYSWKKCAICCCPEIQKGGGRHDAYRRMSRSDCDFDGICKLDRAFANAIGLLGRKTRRVAAACNGLSPNGGRGFATCVRWEKRGSARICIGAHRRTARVRFSAASSSCEISVFWWWCLAHHCRT